MVHHGQVRRIEEIPHRDVQQWFLLPRQICVFFNIALVGEVNRNRYIEIPDLDLRIATFEQQLNLLRPEYIVCLGAVSAQELLKTKLPVGQLRGSLHGYFASKVLVTYHPAYLLRNPAAKKAAWQDLQLLIRDAGIKLPKR